jgi:hypothetical protein
MSSGKQTTQKVTTYSVGMHMVLCNAPIDSISVVQCKEKQVNDGVISGTSDVTMNKPDLFGGLEREGGITGVISFLFGLPSQTVNAYLASKLGTIPAYRGVVSVILNNVYIGTNYYLAPWRFFCTRLSVREKGTTQWQPSVVSPSGQGLINAVHVIRECLTDTEWGLGQAENTIDELSFITAAVTCYNEGLGFSWLYTKESPINVFIADVARHINAVVFRDRADNLWKITLIRKITDLGTLPVLTTNSVQKISKLARKQFYDLTSHYVLKYESNLTYKEASYTVSIPSLAARQGKEISTVGTFSGVATPEVAQLVAKREIRSLSEPTYAGSLVGTRALATLNPGDAFILQAFDAMEANLVLRVVSLDLGGILQDSVTIEFVQDSFETTGSVALGEVITTIILGVPTYSIDLVPGGEDGGAAAGGGAENIITDPIVPGGTLWIPEDFTAVSVVYRKLFESPYYPQALEKGDTTAQAISTSSSFIRMTAVSPSNSAIDAELWDTAATTYEFAEVIDFQFSGLLAENINKVTSTFLVSNLVDSINLLVGDFLYLEEELIYVTAFDLVAETLTVSRGVLDTVPEIHLTGARFIKVSSVHSFDSTEYLVGETIKAKLLTTTPTETLLLASAPEDTITLVGRMHRPYPPGNFQIDGVSWLAETTESGEFILTWTSRNRLQQTTSTILDYYAASVTTEGSVTYNLTLLLDSNDSLLYSYTGSALTRNLTVLDLPEDLIYPAVVRAELNSENLNGVSFQTVTHVFTIPAAIFKADDGTTQFTDSDGTTLLSI